LDKCLLVDTNILYKTEFLDLLQEAIQKNQIEVYIPAIVHAERIRQVADDQGEKFSIKVVHQYLQAYGFQILPLSAKQAEAIADLWITIKSSDYYHDKYWERNRFDMVVCAVASATGYTLVAEDKGKHFDLVKRMSMEEVGRWLDKVLVEI